MDKIFSWIKNNMKLAIAFIFGIVFVIPFLINLIFKIDAPVWFLEAEWNAQDLLNYYGTVLGFLSTLLLSTLALWQNEKIRKLEEAREAPILLCQNLSCSGNYGDLCVSLVNTNNGSMIYNICVYDMKIVDRNNNILSSSERIEINHNWLGSNTQIAEI